MRLRRFVGLIDVWIEGLVVIPKVMIPGSVLQLNKR